MYKNVLVIGACGFIGGRVVEILHLTKQFNIKAGIHKWSSCARIGRFPVEIIIADVMQPNTLRKALADVDVVVNCLMGPDEVVINGTKNLLEAAIENGIKKVIHLSTTEVYGNVSGEISENTNLQKGFNSYGDTKIAAEEICQEYIQKGLPIVTLRPPIVYGPFSTTWSVKIAQNLINRKWSKFEGIANGQCNLLYVDDLVRAIILSIKKDEANGKVFNINGPDNLTWNEYFERFNKSLGLGELPALSSTQSKFKMGALQPVRLVGTFVKKNFMKQVKMIAGRFSPIKILLKNLERTLKSTPSPGDFELYSRDAIFDYSKAKEILSYNPVFDLSLGLELTTKWLKLQGFKVESGKN